MGVDFGFTAVGQQQWNYRGPGMRRPGLAYPALRGANQLLNASAAIAALEALKDQLPTSAQDVREGLARVELPGRFQVIPGEPQVILDVAHNPHAVAVLAENLDALGFSQRTHAVFGAMADKDVSGMLARIAPLIQNWYMCDLPLSRAARATALAAALPSGAQVTCHDAPASAFEAAVAAAEAADRIVVFGSFHTVGGVLEHGLPQLGGRHTTSPSR